MTVPVNERLATATRAGLMSPGDKLALGLVPTLTDWRQGLIETAKTRTWLAQIGAFADGFFDQSNVDVAGSVNLTYDATNKLYYNSTSEATQSFPAQTSNTAPSGYTASASTIYGSSYDAWYAFDQNANTAWVASTNDGNQWIQRQLPSATTVTAYTIATRNDVSQPMTAWNFTGSNDGSTFVPLDSQNGQSVGSTAQRFSIASNKQATYTYYRLYVTGYTTSSNVAELGLLKVGGPLDFRSASIPLGFTPVKGNLFVIVNPVSGTLTPNATLIASLSQNGGTAYTPVPLTLSGVTLRGYLIYEANNVVLPGSGTSLKARIQTTTGTYVQVLGVYAKVQ